MCWIQNWMMQNCICWAFEFWAKNVIFGKKVTLSVFYGKYWKIDGSFGIAFSFLFDIHLIYESIVDHSIIWGKNKHFQHIWQKLHYSTVISYLKIFLSIIYLFWHFKVLKNHLKWKVEKNSQIEGEHLHLQYFWIKY